MSDGYPEHLLARNRHPGTRARGAFALWHFSEDPSLGRFLPNEVGGYQDGAQCADLQAGGKAWPRRVTFGLAGSACQDDSVGYRRAGGSVPARGKSLWSGCKTRGISWQSAAKQEATEVPYARHGLNL
jgi:hypothetical protein